jgi:hypothetical protein
VLATIGGYVAYRELLHYDRRALAHVPAGAELVARVDLEQLLLFEPVRRHLMPLLDHAPVGTSAPAADAPSRLARLREQGVVNLGLDLRELVFARRAAGGWVLVIGGMFDRTGVVEGIERVLEAESGAQLRRDATLLIVEPSGVALGQAEDGVLVVGSDRELVAEVLPARSYPAALGALDEGAASIGALPTWFHTWLGGGAPTGPLASLTRASGWLELHEPLELSFDIELSAASDAAQLRSELEGRLGPGGASDFVPLADWGGERAVLARAAFEQRGPTNLRITSTWELAELNRAARSLANWLGARMRAHRPATPVLPSAQRDAPSAP